jgi:putative ABC transport system permease protein
MSSMLDMDTYTNDLQAFKKYIEQNQDLFNQHSTAIQYGYDIKLNIYSKDNNGEFAKADFYELVNNVLGNESGGILSSGMSLMENAGSVNIWQELITDPQTGVVSNMVTEQYDLVYGKWPTEANEILLVLTKNNEISDITLYSLGLVDKTTMMNSTIAALTGKENTGWDDPDAGALPSGHSRLRTRPGRTGHCCPPGPGKYPGSAGLHHSRCRALGRPCRTGR